MEEHIRISSRSGSQLDAYILKPSGESEPWATILMCGDLSYSKQHVSNFARHFCNEGYACVLLDYEGNHRKLVDLQDQYSDLQMTLQWLRRRESTFDDSRLALWGSRLGALPATRCMTDDGAIRAGIAHCPQLDAISILQRVSILNAFICVFWALLDLLGSFAGLSPIYLYATPIDDGVAISAEPSATTSVKKIAARSLLSFLTAGRISGAKKIMSPYLVVITERGHARMRDAAIQCANSTERGEVTMIPGLESSLDPGRSSFEADLKAQLSFLHRVVPVKDETVIIR